MKKAAACLTPFISSDAVGAILAETLGHPERESSLSDLSRRIGVALPIVHREVVRLVDAGVLSSRMEGRSRLVRASPEHPLFNHMRALVEATYGALPVVREMFVGLAAIEGVYIYGSWAARRAGEPGLFPNDVDVLVVGSTSRRELASRALEASKRLDLPVNVTRLTREEWEADDPTPFVATVRSRPYVDAKDGVIHG